MVFITYTANIISLFVSSLLALYNKEVLFRVFSGITMIATILTSHYMQMPIPLPELVTVIIKILVTGILLWLEYATISYFYNDEPLGKEEED